MVYQYKHFSEVSSFFRLSYGPFISRSPKLTRTYGLASMYEDIFRTRSLTGGNTGEGVAIIYQEIPKNVPDFTADDIDALFMIYFSNHLNEQLCRGWILQAYLWLCSICVQPDYRVEAGGSTSIYTVVNAPIE